MFKKKSFTVKVNEEKEKIKRQEKPKSPTPEPPPVIKQENTLSPPQIQKLQAQETEEWS